jgi:hypothetical protein
MIKWVTKKDNAGQLEKGKKEEETGRGRRKEVEGGARRRRRKGRRCKESVGRRRWQKLNPTG